MHIFIICNVELFIELPWNSMILFWIIFMWYKFCFNNGILIFKDTINFKRRIMISIFGRFINFHIFYFMKIKLGFKYLHICQLQSILHILYIAFYISVAVQVIDCLKFYNLFIQIKAFSTKMKYHAEFKSCHFTYLSASIL